MVNSKKNKNELQAVSGIENISLVDLGITVPENKSDKEFAIWIRALMQNWRQGTVACKGRSDVAHSNKKPWKQKGTGRARAGSARSPLWRGGGVTFGPQKRTRTLTLSQASKDNVRMGLLANYAQRGKLIALNWQLEGDRPKTALFVRALKDAELNNNKITLFLPFNDILTYAAVSNIPNVHVAFFDQVNAFDLAASDTWLVLKKDITLFKEMVSKWS